MVPRVWGRGEGKDWEFAVSRCKLLQIECINNKVLFYSTGNYIQRPVINHKGIYIYIYYIRGFPDSSVGKESTCNARDPSSIPGSGRFPGEGNSYPLQYSGLENSVCNPSK